MRSKFPVALVLSALGTVASATSALCVELNGLEFVMTTDKTAYKVGEPIRVNVTWTNAGTGHLLIPNWRGPTDGPAKLVEGDNTVYEFAVYYEGKEWVEFKAGPSCKPSIGVDLEAKQTVTRSYDVGDSYSFTRPGRYVLRAVQFGYPPDDPDKYWRGRIFHPDVEIWIRE
jgi:hypothetical protein